MRATPRHASAALALAAALAAATLTGGAGAGATTTGHSDRTGGGSAGSRAQLYSLQEMTEAAQVVLTGTAGAQQVLTESAGSAMTTTTTDLVVDEVLHTAAATTSVAAGSTVVVRQTTTAPGWTSSDPEATLEPGQRYLLFLSPSGQGESADDFYPVGAVAGIYQADAGAFTRAVPDSGDDLPTTLTPEQLRG